MTDTEINHRLALAVRTDWADDVFVPTNAKPNAPKHSLFVTDDQDTPGQIKDRNGHVVLSLCKRCGKGEAELDGSASCPERNTMTKAEELKKLIDAFTYQAIGSYEDDWVRIAPEGRGAEINAAIDEMQAEIETLRAQVPELRGNVQRMEHILREKDAEIDRLKSMLEFAYCEKVGADSPNGLGSCDAFEEWICSLAAEPQARGDKT